jgi:hypothetical protein
MRQAILPAASKEESNMACQALPEATVRRSRGPRWSRLRRSAACSILVVAGLALTGGVAGAADTNGTVVVVHGLQGIQADLYLDGASSPALTSFTFRRVTDPLSLQPGLHRADVRVAGSPATSTPLLSGTFNVIAGQRVTVTALLDSSGQPSWLAFPNDAWTFGAADAQIRFRHLAAAGPVNLVVDGAPAITAAVNLASAATTSPLELPAGSHQVAVVDATTGAALVPTQRIDVAGGSIVNLYLTGRTQPASLELLLQGATGEPDATAATAPRVLPLAIETGDSGLLAPVAASHAHHRLATSIAQLAGLLAVAYTFVIATGILANMRRVPVSVRRSR